MDRTTNKMLVAIAFITAIVCSTPILERAVLLAFVSLLIILYLVGNAGKKAPFENSKHIFICFLFIALMFMYNFLGVSDTSLVIYIVPVSFFLIMLMTPYVPLLLRKRKSWEWLFYAMVIVMLLNVISNIYLCIRYPEINLASTREYMSEEMLANLNVGSTRFYTFTLFFFDVCFFVFLNCKEKKLKYFMLISSIITAIYICVYCLKAAVVLFFLLSIFFLYYSRRNRQSKSFFAVVGISGLLVLLLVMTYTDEIINFIVAVSPSERITVRLVTLLDADNAAASSVTLTNRTDLYMLSVQTWLSSPTAFFFGIGDHPTTYDLAATGIGHHSEFLDSLARYGLVGFFMLYFILAKSIKNVARQFDSRYKLQIYVIFFVYILSGFVKGAFLPGVGCVLYLLLPLTSIVLENEKK